MTPDEFELQFLRTSETAEDRRRFILSGIIAVMVISLVLLAVAYPDIALQLLQAYLDD